MGTKNQTHVKLWHIIVQSLVFFMGMYAVLRRSDTDENRNTKHIQQSLNPFLSLSLPRQILNGANFHEIDGN